MDEAKVNVLEGEEEEEEEECSCQQSGLYKTRTNTEQCRVH